MHMTRDDCIDHIVRKLSWGHYPDQFGFLRRLLKLDPKTSQELWAFRQLVLMHWSRLIS